MSSSLSFHFPKALPPLSTITQRRSVSLSLISQQKQSHNSKPDKVARPAFAVTGVNNEGRFHVGFDTIRHFSLFYFLVVPPFIMNWLRKDGTGEIFKRCICNSCSFFPGLLLWAPFLNFRKFPRDPSMKYTWETPEDPSKIKNAYLKYPWATPEDYDLKLKMYIVLIL